MRTYSIQESDMVGEALGQEFMAGLRSGYGDQMSSQEKSYEKYEAVAKATLDKAREMSQFMEKKLHLPPILAISAVAAGLTGGAGAIPAAVLMYFAKKYYVKGIEKAVDYTVDKAAGMMSGQQQGLQPESVSFKAWLDEYEEGVGDWAARTAGYGIGRAAGLVSGIGKGIYHVVSNRMKEFASFVQNDPKKAAKVAMTIALAAATGGAVGKISGVLVNDLGNAMQGLVPDHGEVAAIQQTLGGGAEHGASIVSSGTGAKAAWSSYVKQGAKSSTGQV